jgi:amino acid permease
MEIFYFNYIYTILFWFLFIICRLVLYNYFRFKINLAIFFRFIPNLIEAKFGADSIFADKWILSIILSIFLIIYSYQNDISVIKKSASWGFAAIIFLLGLIIYDLLYCSRYGILKQDHHSIKIMDYKSDYIEIISNISCIILSFSFHSYTFSIYECLEKKDINVMMRISAIGIFVSMGIYLLIGSVGYVIYVDLVNENYIFNLEDYPMQRYLQSIAFVLNVVMSFPLSFFSLRHYLVFIVQIILTKLSDCFRKKKENNDKVKDILDDKEKEINFIDEKKSKK